MRQHSKRYQALLEEGPEDPRTPRPVEETVRLVKQGASAKFAESVDLALDLNIDTRQADQLVRGSFSLPHGTGKAVRVVAFAEGPDAEAAREAGAVEAGGQELVERVQGGWMDFDVAVAHPSMMRHVGKLGRLLGPKGLMPSPKSGTVTPNVADAVKEFAGGRIEFRNDPQGNLSVCVGRADFTEQQLADNVQALLNHLRSLRPAAVKGQFIQTATLSSTMGLGYRVAV